MPQYKEFTFNFIINNFTFHIIENQNEISSPNFTIEDADTKEWRVKLIYGYDEMDSITKRISLELCRDENLNSRNKMIVDFQMELYNAENKVLYISEKKKKMWFFAGTVRLFSNVLQVRDLEEKIRDTSKDTLILKCRMGVISKWDENSLSRSCTIQFTPCLDELSYMRTVNYSESPDWSSKLSFPISKIEQLNIEIENEQDDILFKISFENSEEIKFRNIKCEITLLDRKGKEKFSFYDSANFSNDEVWNFPTFLRKTSLEKDTRLLHLKFTLTFSNGLILEEHIDETTDQNPPISTEVSKNLPATNSVISDLRKMLFSKEHADVSFCVNSEIISAHKFILASRSPVFSAMFLQKMVENETGVIDISDIDVQTLKLFLEFLYTGDLPESDWERVLELLLAAEKYQVPTLKEECSQFLKNNLNPDNVCNTLSVADMVDEQTLKNAAMDYIKGNVKTVLRSSKWFEFIDKNPKLCSEIFYNFSEDLKS